jgi:hypothetical protein
VQVGAADRGRRDLDDHVGRILDLGVVDVLDGDLVGLLVDS